MRERTVYVGRETELATLEAAIGSAAEGLPAVCLVSGDAGMGKTTLITEAAARAKADLLLARAPHVANEPIPLAPLIDLLRQVRRSDHGALLDDPALTPLRDLIGGSPIGVDRTSSLSVFDAALALLGQMEGVTVVAFDDLHWADELTWDLFEFLARNLTGEQVVTIAASRRTGIPVHHRARLAELDRLPGAHRVDLDPLDAREVARQVAAVTGKPAAPDVIDTIVARSGGNPLFAEELALARATDDEMPRVLRDLLAADVAALDPTTRRVLDALATVGRDTPHDLLASVAAVDDEVLERALHEAIDADVVVFDNVSDSYHFRHPLLGEVVGAGLLPSERRRLHTRVAAALAAVPSRTLTPSAPHAELALHLDRAGDTEGAWRASLSAADELASLAPSAALQHLLRAIDLWETVGDPGEDRKARLWQAADLAEVVGLGDDAVRLGEAAMELGPPDRGTGWGHERLARYLWVAGRLDESAVEYERSAEDAQSATDSSGVAAVQAGLAQAEMLFCNYATAAERAVAALDAAPRGAPATKAWIDANRVLAFVRSREGESEAAVDHARAAVSAAVRADDRSLATIYLAEVLLHAARYEEAVAVALDGVADAQRAGFDRTLGGYLSAMAVEGLVPLGRWDEADAILGHLHGIDAVPPTRLRLDLAGASLSIRRDSDPEPALALLAGARDIPVDPWHQLFRHATTADVLLIAGNATDARQSVLEAQTAVCADDRRWPARFVRLSVTADVEIALNRRALGEHVDVDAVSDELRKRVHDARTRCRPPETDLRDEIDAEIRFAEAYLTCLTEPYPNGWSTVAAQFEALGDRWTACVARLHEAEASASTAATARAVASLQHGYRTACELGAAPLIRRAKAISRRTRMSLEPVPELTDAKRAQLGLTSREAEVLALVAAGNTNREIGEALFVSDKTASVHVSNILRKLGVRTRVDAAAVAQRAHLA